MTRNTSNHPYFAGFPEARASRFIEVEPAEGIVIRPWRPKDPSGSSRRIPILGKVGGGELSRRYSIPANQSSGDSAERPRSEQRQL